MEVLRLKELLSEKNLTGKELASKVGVSNVAISNIASNNSFPKPELMLKIAEVLDVDIRELFKPTKEVNLKPIYIKEGENFVQIGEIKI